MRFFGLAACDTCRRARKELAAAGRDAEVIDIREAGIPPDLAAEMVAALGPGVVNRASTTWRGLTEEERAQPPEALLTAHPLLMKRPVIEAGGRWSMGWKDEARARALGE
ncbi:arsenate reductase family protein [Pseudoroseicyclus sp. CXY001]|uniref:arsenate reductase family protein n=1 Tax=Pseudoroseicyclus sp. CXY001 TaxID=3242492 RepID=UPI0035717703